MNFEFSIEDISYSLAVAAHSGTSFMPERRAESERQGYVEDMQQVADEWRGIAKTQEQLELAACEFDRFRANYIKRYTALLHSESRVVSSMIAGPSNFPVRRMQKRMDVVDRRRKDFLDWYKRARTAAEKRIREADPNYVPDVISSDRADAVDLLERKLDELQRIQEHMRAVNAAHKAFVKKPESLDSSSLSEREKTIVREYKPAYSWEPHPFAPYQLSNNNANIKRVEGRIAQLRHRKAQETKETEFDSGVRVVDNVEANRVQVFFPGKPSERIRAELKRRGFRWSPRESAWQAYPSAKCHVPVILELVNTEAAA